MDKVIVTTSINPPTEAIEKFDNFKDWTLLVIGDKKTPIGYKLKNGIYFSPKEQVKLDKKLSDLIGWNCIERRNFGLIYAKKIGAKTILVCSGEFKRTKDLSININETEIHDTLSDFLRTL